MALSVSNILYFNATYVDHRQKKKKDPDMAITFEVQSTKDKDKWKNETHGRSLAGAHRSSSYQCSQTEKKGNITSGNKTTNLVLRALPFVNA